MLIRAEPRSDGALSVVEAWDFGCVLSNGHELLIKWSKLATLAGELCQEQAAVTVRIWTVKDGDELIELHRVGERSTKDCSVPTSNEAF